MHANSTVGQRHWGRPIAAVAGVILALIGSGAVAQSQRAKEILAGADARIEQHRKADAALVLATGAGAALPAGTALHIRQTRHAFLFGACTQWLFSMHGGESRLDTEPALGGRYAKQFAELFNFCTTQIYWGGYERERGKPQHALTQKNLDWAEANGMAIKGHPLAWNYVMEPLWLREADQETLLREQRARITREMKRFPGMMWDVVNESAHYDREPAWRGGPGLTKAMQDIGPDKFVRMMFECARAADPSAFLLTNDYVLDERYDKNGILPLINEDGTALFDAIGIQSHMHGGVWPVEKTWNACERLAKYGKPLHFTELTIISGDGAVQKRKRENPRLEWPTTPDGEAWQADEVAQFYTLLFSHPAVEAITWWNFTDNRAWQGAPAGLIRADMTPKPVYERLKTLIKETWWTDIKQRSDAGESIAFRGFLGSYAVEARTPDGQVLHGTFDLGKDSGSIEVHMEAR